MLPQIDNQMNVTSELIEIPSKTYKLDFSSENPDYIADAKNMVKFKMITDVGYIRIVGNARQIPTNIRYYYLQGSKFTFDMEFSFESNLSNVALFSINYDEIPPRPNPVIYHTYSLGITNNYIYEKIDSNTYTTDVALQLGRKYKIKLEFDLFGNSKVYLDDNYIFDMHTIICNRLNQFNVKIPKKINLYNFSMHNEDKYNEHIIFKTEFIYNIVGQMLYLFDTISNTDKGWIQIYNTSSFYLVSDKGHLFAYPQSSEPEITFSIVDGNLIATSEKQEILNKYKLIGYNIYYETDIYNDRIIGKIDNLEAIRQAVYHILMTERYAYLIYSNNYGVELQQYIGKDFDYFEMNIETTLKEALMYDLRIKNVVVNEIKRNDKDKANVKFTVYSIYGDLQLEVNISV